MKATDLINRNKILSYLNQIMTILIYKRDQYNLQNVFHRGKKERKGLE